MADSAFSIFDSYIFANTPGYLLKKIVTSYDFDCYLQLDAEDLFDKIKSKSNESGSIAEAYASIVSLLKNGRSSQEIIPIVDQSKLRWAREICARYEKEIQNTNIRLVDFPKFEEIITERSGENDNTSSIIISNHT
jgi:hypothetical protein